MFYEKVTCQHCQVAIRKNVKPVTCYSCFLAFHDKWGKLTSKKFIKSTEHFVCKICKNNLFPFHNLADEEFLLELGMVAQYSLNAEHLNKIFLEPKMKLKVILNLAICHQHLNLLRGI